MPGAQQEFRQAAEIVFQRLFVEGNAGQAKKVILEVIQVPGDGLPVEAGPRIAHLVIQIAPSLDLEPRQYGYDFAIGLNRLRSNVLASAILRKKLKKRRAAQVFFQISIVRQIFSINFRNGQTVLAKVPGKFEESDILFTDVVQNTNRTELPTAEPDDLSTRAPEFSLERLYLLSRRVEGLGKKLF